MQNEGTGNRDVRHGEWMMRCQAWRYGESDGGGGRIDDKVHGVGVSGEAGTQRQAKVTPGIAGHGRHVSGSQQARHQG
jgi:hypothetical protein